MRATDATGNLSAYSNVASAATGSGLVAAYGFDEGSGTTLADASGNGYTGTLTNGPAWTTGKFGSALQFSASDDGNDTNDPRVVLGRTINIPNLPLTISVWVNPTDYADYRAILSKRDSPIASNMRIDFGLSRGGGGVYVFTGSSNSFSYAPPLNSWTHLALAADSSGTRLYVNGVLQQTIGVITLGTNTSANTVIGGTGEGAAGDNDPFKGKIDDLRIYSRALSQAEIQADMNTPVGTPPAADTSPPTAPVGLAAATVSATQINLTWSASTDNVGVTGYRLERCQGTGCSSFAEIALPAGTSFGDSGLAASTSYSYRVRATDAAGNLSGYSNVASATTQTAPDTTPPTAPAVLSASVGSASQIDLSWTPSTDNVGVTGYQIDRCEGSGCTAFAQIATSSVASFSDTGLAASTTYRYRVRATDAAGNVSANSSIVTATTQAVPDTTPPTAPAGLAATAVSATQINLTWNASTDNVGVSGYRVFRCTGASCTTFAQIATSAAASYSDTGLIPSTTYQYRVQAVDAAGNLSADSNTVSMATLSDTTPPTAPAGLAATAVSTTQINLTWNASTDNVGVTGYRLERCQGAGCSSFAEIASPTGTSFGDTGLSASTSYSYRVRATDAAGNLSGYSNVPSATTQAVPDTTPPTAPVGLAAATVSATQINLTWSASTDNVGVTGYRLERCQGTGCSSFAEIALPAGTSFGDSGLAASTSYSYRVRATDAAGNLSGYSNVASATTQTAPDTTPPTAPAVLSASVGSASQIDLSWTPSTDNVGVTGYQIDRCQGTGCTTFAQIATSTVTSFSDTGLAASTTYRYRVRATDAAGNVSANSSIVTATTQAVPDTTPPTAPAGLVGHGGQRDPDQSDLDGCHRQCRGQRLSTGALPGRGLHGLCPDYDRGRRELQRHRSHREYKLQLPRAGDRCCGQFERLLRRGQRHHASGSRHHAADRPHWLGRHGGQPDPDQSDLECLHRQCGSDRLSSLSMHGRKLHDIHADRHLDHHVVQRHRSNCLHDLPISCPSGGRNRQSQRQLEYGFESHTL